MDSTVGDSTHRHHSDRRSRSATNDSQYKDHNRSRSRTNSRSRSYSRSSSRSRYSRSRSDSLSDSRSRSRTSSHSRSGSRARNRSYSSRSRRYRPRSRSYDRDSRDYSSSGSNNSRDSISPDGRDPRDRSKRAKWDNAIWIIGEKANDTTFHFCDICDLPIVIYGRLLPCKHVLCYSCAANLQKKCHRCQKAIQSIERSLVGGIFMCFESETCRRTYLSQRDLQAHIDHRHKSSDASSVKHQDVKEPEVVKAVSAPQSTAPSTASLIPTISSSRDRPAKVLSVLTSQATKGPSGFLASSNPSTDQLSQPPGFMQQATAKFRGLVPLPGQASVQLAGPIRQAHNIALPTDFTRPPPQFNTTRMPPPGHPGGAHSLMMPPTSMALLNRNPAIGSAVAALAAAAAAALNVPPGSGAMGQQNFGCGGSRASGLPSHVNPLTLLSNVSRGQNPSWPPVVSTAAPVPVNPLQSLLRAQSSNLPTTLSGAPSILNPNFKY